MIQHIISIMGNVLKHYKEIYSYLYHDTTLVKVFKNFQLIV